MTTLKIKTILAQQWQQWQQCQKKTVYNEIEDVIDNELKSQQIWIKDNIDKQLSNDDTSKYWNELISIPNWQIINSMNGEIRQDGITGVIDDKTGNSINIMKYPNVPDFTQDSLYRVSTYIWMIILNLNMIFMNHID